MYSSDLGKFVGRDPMGYVDGFRLYGGYFIPNTLDPFGLFRGFGFECGGRWYPMKAYLGYACCNDQLYNTNTHGCCGGAIYDKSLNSCANKKIVGLAPPDAFWWYGNWGGPGWSNGGWNYEGDTKYNIPTWGDPGFAEPIDARDMCYYLHDHFINACVKYSNFTRYDLSDCLRKVDHFLAKCLRITNSGCPIEACMFDTIIPWFFHDPDSCAGW